jgi:transcriptional regulator with XRE-family HTH domain
MVTSSHPVGFARELLALNMRAMRTERGWSQEFLAFETGLHRTFITHCERGVRNISIDNIEKIARAFDVPISELFTPRKQH